MSISEQDKAMDMGEPASVPETSADDSAEPITAEWCFDHLPNNPFSLCCPAINGQAMMMTGFEQLPNVKTRGDLRELCRLLGITLNEEEHK